MNIFCSHKNHTITLRSQIVLLLQLPSPHCWANIDWARARKLIPRLHSSSNSTTRCHILRPSRFSLQTREVAIKWSAAPDMTPQTVLYRRPVAQFSNFQPKIVSSWLILALFQANFLISGRSRLCPYQLVNSNQVRQGE